MLTNFVNLRRAREVAIRPPPPPHPFNASDWVGVFHFSIFSKASGVSMKKLHLVTICWSGEVRCPYSESIKPQFYLILSPQSLCLIDHEVYL